VQDFACAGASGGGENASSSCLERGCGHFP
jgi:hypothetical protein